MLDHQIKRTWVVTHHEACDGCHALTDVNGLLPKQRYVYGQGYVKMAHSCQACFDKEVAVKEDAQKASNKPNGWESV